MRAIRFNKRPLNICKSCNYTWYPRGKSVSAVCPNCGSRETDLALAVFLANLFWLLKQPFILVYRLLRVLSGSGIPFVISALERAGAIIIACAKWFVIPFQVSGNWILSVKDDFGEKDGDEQSPWGFVAKLIVLAVISVVLLILGIRQVI